MCTGRKVTRYNTNQSWTGYIASREAITAHSDEVAAGHSNRTSVLFRPKHTPATLLRCADSSKLRSRQSPS
jgi:hypothetical protein